VAVIGVVFYQALGTFADAFARSEVVLAGIAIAVAGLVQLLPRR
jgi:hypothetical protein